MVLMKLQGEQPVQMAIIVCPTLGTCHANPVIQIEWLRHAADPSIAEAGGNPDFAGSGLWRLLLAPRPSANNVLSLPEPRGFRDSLWRPFLAHFRQLPPISALSITSHIDPIAIFMFLFFQ